jgi:hypothetical protein
METSSGFLGHWLARDYAEEIAYQLEIKADGNSLSLDFIDGTEEPGLITKLKSKGGRLGFDANFYDMYLDVWQFEQISIDKLQASVQSDCCANEYLRLSNSSVESRFSKDEHYREVDGRPPGVLCGLWEFSSGGDWEGVPTMLLNVRRLRNVGQYEISIYYDDGDIARIDYCKWANDTLHVDYFLHFNHRYVKNTITMADDGHLMSAVSFRQDYIFMREPTRVYLWGAPEA